MSKKLVDILGLVSSLNEEETNILKTTFLAPCLPDSKVRVRVKGLIREFKAPRKYEGWGMFAVTGMNSVKVDSPADQYSVYEYLQLFPKIRLRLIMPVSGMTWLAYPANESDAKQRLGEVKPVLVHLVTEGARFESIVAAIDGKNIWFMEVDRRADPHMTEYLNKSITDLVKPEDIRVTGLTPEMRTAYQLLVDQENAIKEKIKEAEMEKLKLQTDYRLNHALKVGGGTLQSYLDRGEHWVVEWSDSRGNRHSSAISKDNLTVLTSGICLAGNDRKFDLESLVGVIEVGNQRGYRDYNNYPTNDYGDEDDYDDY